MAADAAKGPLIAVSMGEPAGIGTEILFKAYEAFAALPPDRGNPVFFVIDDPVRLERTARAAGLSLRLNTISDTARVPEIFYDALPVLPLSSDIAAPLAEVTPGKPVTGTAPAVLESIERAVSAVLGGRADAVVTLPIQKETLNDSGFAHAGHTEYLEVLTADAPMPDGVDRGAVMMLAAGTFRVIPATIHVPLAEVPQSLTQGRLIRTALIATQSLMRDFGIKAPRLAISGLNPHAGEGGKLGAEEQQVIAPAIEAIRARQINAFGPFPADTMFHEDARQQYDAAITMYHDQALIPIKTVAFHGAVNLTLGLPIVRTSPDHGTGLAIAGKGIARADSLVNAMIEAGRMAGARMAFRAAHD